MKTLKGFIKKLFRKIKLQFNKSGNVKKCYICNKSFRYFSKYRNGYKDASEFRTKLVMVGSDVDNYGCVYCGSNDRERHLFMFFDKLQFWNNIKNSKILHIAPEKNLSAKIKSLNPHDYICGDLSPQNDSILQIDATKIPYKDNTFDIIICNHVLEHIPKYLSAINEIYRVLKPNGVAILQTPYSRLLKHNFEEENINTGELRFYFYGDKDHFRIFSENHLFLNLKAAGFDLQIVKHSEYFDDDLSYCFGVNKKEDLIRAIKTDSL